MYFSTFIYTAIVCLGMTNALAVPGDIKDQLRGIARRTPSPAQLFKRTCPLHSLVGATYYTSGTNPNQITACGEVLNLQAYTVAISVELENAIGGISYACGRPISITDAVTGNQVYATIMDSNATGDLGEYALDLTPVVYNALGGDAGEGNDPGERTIYWQLEDNGYNACF